jgi:NhaP-type Na+/H+ and K+/H+ antiporter
MDLQGDEVRGHRLQAVAESTLAKSVSRFVVPVLITVIGWFLMRTTDRIEVTQQKQGDDLAQVKSDVRDLGTRLDAQVIRQVETNTKRIDALDERVQKIEREVPVR